MSTCKIWLRQGEHDLTYMLLELETGLYHRGRNHLIRELIRMPFINYEVTLHFQDFGMQRLERIDAMLYKDSPLTMRLCP